MYICVCVCSSLKLSYSSYKFILNYFYVFIFNPSYLFKTENCINCFINFFYSFLKMISNK